MPKVYIELDNLSREELIQLLLNKEEEMETLKTIIVNNNLEQKADWKHIEELEEKCENLKSDVSIYKSQMNTYKKKYLALLKSNTELEEENKKLKDENRNLKSELSKFRDSFKKYRDYEKEELAESCYDLARENEKLKEENRNLKSEIENMKKVGRENIETLDRMSIELENYSKSFKRYRDFSKQELADSLYDAEEQNKKLKERIGELEKEIEELNKMMLFETKI